MNIEFSKARESDAEELLVILKEAFLPLFEKYGDEESPYNTTVEELRTQILNPYGEYTLITADGQTAGGIWVHGIYDEPDAMYLHVVYIRPSLQGKGIAQAAIQYAHRRYPECKVWVLDVPDEERKNIHLYEKCGYERTKEKEIINEKLTIVTYVKKS